MKCKNCGDVDPYMKKTDYGIDSICPDCKKNLGTIFELDFSDEEMEILKAKYGTDNPQELMRNFHKIFDKIIDEGNKDA